MNLDCRVPKSRVSILRRIEIDPAHDHYSPCEISSLLAMGWIKSVMLNNGFAVLEITDDGYKVLAFDERENGDDGI